MNALMVWSYQDILYIFYILCRVSGIFIISPLLSNVALTGTVRFYLSFFVALLIGITLHKDYFGPHPKYILSAVPHSDYAFIISLTIEGIKETIVGYVIGFLFNVIFEAMLLAGNMIDTMIGLATAQFIDPISNSYQSMLGTFILLFGFLFMLSIDFHYVFIKVIAQSFSVIPLGDFILNPQVISNISYGTSLIFSYAIKIGAVPFVILACGLIGPAITVRVVPEMNLLLIGFPMRVLIALYMLMIAISHIPPVFLSIFSQITGIVENTLLYMGHSE